MKNELVRYEKGFIKDLTFCCRPPIRKRLPNDARSRLHCACFAFIVSFGYGDFESFLEFKGEVYVSCM
ncbi:Uncharacterised protein [Bartonella grahamii]|uniref:Uncharacterized protein n=1 Tax=Bartonella grahamii TaxID=33045 RepID=A0A336NBI1_BARGR|nr:Uncharacterised protein [Bartonella grahamii]